MSTQAVTQDVIQQQYNETPYQSFSFSNTYPTHLFTLATLFGLTPQKVEKARILELGCASGGNLIPMSVHFPNAECLGIDLSENQINQGLQRIDDLKLKNITLRHQSILDFASNEGKFDYIICHGVYSWVSSEVRNKILQICNENLSKNGIAYISYNTFPGWNMVNSVRDMMIWHTKNFTDPSMKAQQARSVLKFITDGLQADPSPYAAFLKNEINLLSKHADYYLLHEHLSPYNEPIYFHQFVEQASTHKLSYLADAILFNMCTDNLSPQFSTELKKLTNIVAVEQYMDFIRNQRFRSTLLCHETQKINRSLKTNNIEQYYLQFVGKCDKPNFSESDIDYGVEMNFTMGNISLKIRHPISLWAMLILIQQLPKPIHYNELCTQISAKLSTPIALVKQHLNDEVNLMRLVFAGMITISLYPGNYVTKRTEKPIACPLARYQAKNQNYVTNRHHQTVGLDLVTKALLPFVDGTHEINDFIKIIIHFINDGKLSVIDDQKQPITDQNIIAEKVAQLCENSLDFLAKHALLIEGKASTSANPNKNKASIPEMV